MHNCVPNSTLQVFHHPEILDAGVLFWSHHEKIVVIDQTLAFVGGIDLAYGCWDNTAHFLTDQEQAPTPPAAVSYIGYQKL